MIHAVERPQAHTPTHCTAEQYAEMYRASVDTPDAFWLEQAQRLFAHTGHQVGHVFLQRLHGAREHIQRLGVGGDGAGIHCLKQALGGLAIHIDTAQTDNQQRAGSLVQILAGEAQRCRIARTDDLRIGDDIGCVFAELAHGIVERGAHVGRNPRQRGEITCGHGGFRTNRGAPGRLKRGRMGLGGLGGRLMTHVCFQKAGGGCRDCPGVAPSAFPPEIQW